ncbi:hypothetical protein B0H11DRAFT_1911615 [Mycena galericulata]|nr:hypothetical protein B0H11DRAFT_1911615 [Mycena galericulata]
MAADVAKGTDGGSGGDRHCPGYVVMRANGCIHIREEVEGGALLRVLADEYRKCLGASRGGLIYESVVSYLPHERRTVTDRRTRFQHSILPRKLREVGAPGSDRLAISGCHAARVVNRGWMREGTGLRRHRALVLRIGTQDRERGERDGGKGRELLTSVDDSSEYGLQPSLLMARALCAWAVHIQGRCFGKGLGVCFQFFSL